MEGLKKTNENETFPALGGGDVGRGGGGQRSHSLGDFFAAQKTFVSLNPNGPELLESLKLRGGGQMAPPSEFTNYNPNAKTDVTLYSQL